MAALTMRRSGSFALRALGPNHCGVDAQLTVEYEVFIRCSPRLDSRGFLFDQLTVAHFFETIGSSTLSCEQLAEDCARRLIDRIHQENPDCEIHTLRVRLSPAPFAASMEFSCHPRLEERRQRRAAVNVRAQLDGLMRDAQAAL